MKFQEQDVPVGTKTKNGRYRLLGYRAICEPLNVDAIRDSWLWMPEESRSKFKAFRVLQVGTYKLTSRRPAAEVVAGNAVLVDCSMGGVEIKEGNKKLRLVSLHDVAAILE